jgi:DNA-binding GntR family transcriptional regulator
MSGSDLGLVPVHQEAAPLRRRVSSALRRAIEVGTLPPGSRLIEKDLCAKLNVSRTSLREAMRELETEGLLTMGPKGLFVAQISIDEALNIYAVRAELEGLLVKQFVDRADDEAMGRLATLASRLEEAFRSDAIDEILAAKAEFYELLCSGARNAVMLELLRSLNTRVNRLRFASLSRPNRAAASIREIRSLVEALRRRDAIGAREIALAHINAAAHAALSGSTIYDKEIENG